MTIYKREHMKKIGILMVVMIVLSSCNKTKESDHLTVSDKANNENLKASNQEQSQAYNLFKNTCYPCHSVTSKSHDEIIAPPMIAVKRRYLMTYPDKDIFVNALVDFSKDPKDDKALMFGAVQQFRVMTNLNFNEEDLKKIATYIYENDIEKPDWFDAHFKEEHGGKMGKGRQ